MGTLWFCLVALMIAIYVLLDGFDLGAGAIHLLVAKTDEERRQVLASIGPVWDANEVWLLAAGGTLYFAFPVLYASGFSGFYLPLMIVLWLLILRGTSIEFRNHIHSVVWDPFWDFLFCASSFLLTGNSGLVFDPCGAAGAHCSGESWSAMGKLENEWSCPREVASPGKPVLVGRPVSDGHRHVRKFSHTTSNHGSFSQLAVGRNFSGTGNCRHGRHKVGQWSCQRNQEFLGVGMLSGRNAS